MNIQDIPDSLEEIWAWSEVKHWNVPYFRNLLTTANPVQEYEKVHMIPTKVNQQVACYTMGELLSAVPEAFGLKNFAEKLSICMLEDRVREAMMLVYMTTFFFLWSYSQVEGFLNNPGFTAPLSIAFWD